MWWSPLIGILFETGQVMIPEFLRALDDGRIDGDEWKKSSRQRSPQWLAEH